MTENFENAKPASGLTSDQSSEAHAITFDNPLLARGTPVIESERGEVIRSRMYELSEPHFRHNGMACRDLGWAVYPQTREGTRRPGAIPGLGAIKLKPLQDGPASVADVRFWSEKLPTLNVACVLTEGLVAVDIDVGKTSDSGWVQRLAYKILGLTPFRRQGREPRMALIYRVAPGTDLRSASYRLEVEGKPTDDQIEILAKGKSITFYGAHHSTGDYFHWGDLQPSFASPDAAPLITREQLTEFLDAVDHWRTLSGYRAAPVSHFTAEAIEFDGKVHSPSSRMEWGVWERQGLGKLIVDGREQWMFRRAGRFASLNAAAMADNEGAKAVFAAYLKEALRYVARTGEWATDAAIRTVAEQKFKAARIALLEGRIKAAVVAVNDDGTRETVSGDGVLAIAGDLGDAASWIAPAGSKTRRKSPTRIIPKVDADHVPDWEKAKQLALLDEAERIAVGERVAREVRESIDAWLTLLWDNAARIVALLEDGHSLPDALREVGALIAPTGAGKTSTLIAAFADMVRARGPLPFALTACLPTHANASEVKGMAIASGAEDVWNEVLAASRGLRVLQFKGKVLAGCLLGERMAKLQQAGIGTTGMCSQTVKNALGEKEVVECPHKSVCPAMKQIELAEKADLILIPHAYLTSPLPKPVKDRIGAIVIDERFWPEVVKTATFPLDALRQLRPPPHLTKSEKRDGVTVEDLVRERDEVCEVATKALLAGQCPAAALNEYVRPERKQSVLATISGRKQKAPVRLDGLAMVSSAITVCSRAQASSLSVRPDMTDADVDKLIERPESVGALVEWRFWSIVKERIVALRDGSAQHGRERRIKMLRPSEGEPEIRVAWRGKINFGDRPAFLLDASANARILSKVFGKRPVAVRRVEAPLHLRCVVVADSFADQALLPDASANKTKEDKDRAADKLSKVRSVITRLGGLYGTERVLVGSTLPVERAIKNHWASPPNADFGHYGAFRGLNAYKNHAVALSIGRMELPIDVLDGLSAALGYDDETEEPDWNVDGTGWVGTQRLRAPQGERRLQRRDGAFVTVKDSVFSDAYPWHRDIQAQFREEELRQFAGRLRPVYRTGQAPLWICAATCVPDGIVVDDVIDTLGGLIGNEMHEFARRLAGVIDAGSSAIQADLPDDLMMIGKVASFSGREAAAYASAHVWVDGEANPRLIHIAAWVPDLDAAIEESQRRLGRYIDRIEIVNVRPEINRLAIVPEPSKLDRQMSRLPNADTASRDELLQERADAEAALRERLIERHNGRPPLSRKFDVEMILANCRPAEEPPKPPPEALAA